MTDYTKLVEALRILQDKNSLSYYKRQVCKDAADAIEKLVTLYEKAEMDATNLTGRLAQAEADIDRLNLEIDKRIATEIELSNQVDALQAEVKRLKDSNDELREKQTFIDNWGTRWSTSAKDVPDSAYKHGYADGKYEALTLEKCIDRLHELGWLQEHDRILSQPHWVSVEERLPNVDEKVLVFAVGKLDGFVGDTVIALTSMSDTNWLNHHEKVDKPYWLDPWQYFLTDYRITHWMPLPEPPQEDA